MVMSLVMEKTVNPSASLGVIIPTMPGREKSFKESFESALECRAHEIVIVTPNPNILKNLISKHSEVRVLQDSGVGAAAAINIGLRVLESSFGAWIGDDDKLIKDGIIESLARLQMNDLIIATYGQVFYNSDSRRVLYKPGLSAERTPGRLINKVAQPGSVFRRLDSGKFMELNENLKFAFDEQLFVDLRRFGNLSYIEQPVAEYLWHAGSLSAGQRKEAIREAVALRWKNASLGKKAIYSLPWMLMLIDAELPSRTFARRQTKKSWQINEIP